MDVIVKPDSYKIKVIPSVAEYMSACEGEDEWINILILVYLRYGWRASTATPAFYIHGIL